jgi:hypothetical protein
LTERNQRIREKGGGAYTDGGSDDGGDNPFLTAVRLRKLPQKVAFAAFYQSSLMSFSVAWDGLLSQVDASKFIWDVCNTCTSTNIPELICQTPSVLESGHWNQAKICTVHLSQQWSIE